MTISDENKINNTSTSINGNIEKFSKETPTTSNNIDIPSITLPKGGGALKGIDEKFKVNATNGTAAFTVPLPITTGRSGFNPSMSLSYNSGSGNSSFGLGWDIDLPAIQLKTDKQLPCYDEGSVANTYMFSGVEDLVPYLLEQATKWEVKFSDNNQLVVCYRPRIEGSFSRIEKITHPQHGVYWKVTTKENVTIILGRSKNCRIADPADEAKIFKWLPEFSFDDKGNWIIYEYKEDGNLTLQQRAAIPAMLHEQNRKNGNLLFINRCIKRIKYGNVKPYYLNPELYFNPSLPQDTNHFYELVFDYGEHDETIPEINETANAAWDYRADAYSDHRAGFEIRTLRLCKRILMFHQFDELGVSPFLVRSLNFNFKPSSINNSGQAEVTYLDSVIQSGYIRKADNSYSKKSLPALEFTYQELFWNKEIKEVSRDTIINAPVGLTNNYQWIDFYGEGISGILTEQGNNWYYKNNLGDTDEDGRVQFEVAKIVASRPSFSGLSSGVLQLRDLESNGDKQIVVNMPGKMGYFQLSPENDWEPFRSFLQSINIDPNDASMRLIDLNGDGMPDLVMSEENVFTWYPSEGKKGYASARSFFKSFDEEKGPAIVFAEKQQTIFLADMTGDGLTDIVRIRAGEICYWANMGHGRFSAKINMSNAPLLDVCDQFNPAYIHLADISGTGLTGIIYTGKNKCTAYLNLSGNAWGSGVEIETLPPVQNKNQLAVIDLLGTGTACITWSSDYPSNADAPMRFIDLMSSKKPHVLIKYLNNFGKETSIEYKSSTYFFLKDKLEGKPWITKLPFPVQVIHKTTIAEKVTNVKFMVEYRYHHGYYDAAEKEFRGFGMVEHKDTEEYVQWKRNAITTKLNTAETLFQKPVLTKTWYHTGAFLDKEKLLTQFETEYWYQELKRFDASVTVSEPTLPDAKLVASKNIIDHKLISHLSVNEWREALRACKGMVLREEIFALDAPEYNAASEQIKLQLTPFNVTTHNCIIQLLQPQSINKHAVFTLSESESISFHYERNFEDPRIVHSLNTIIDDQGNVIENASVVYGRVPLMGTAAFDVLRNTVTDFGGEQQLKNAFINNTAFAEAAQQKMHISYTSTTLTDDLINDLVYRLRLISETKNYEITGFNKTAGIFLLEDFADVLKPATIEIGYHEKPDLLIKQRRPIEITQTLYYTDDLTGSLPLKQHGIHGLVYQNYQLAYTPALLQDLFGNKIADANTTMFRGKYVQADTINWWVPSGRIAYKMPAENFNLIQDRFFSPIFFVDAFGSETKVHYYKNYFLLIQSVTDQLQNTTRIDAFDFRMLAMRRMRDVNNNLSEVIYDELGLVKAIALLGKDMDKDGIVELEVADDLSGIEVFFEQDATDINLFYETTDSAQLQIIAKKLLKNASSRFVYDFDQYKNSGSATVVAIIKREEHHNQNSNIQIGFTYSDGMGNIAMSKTQAEPGWAKKTMVQPDGTIIITDVDTRALALPALRWVGSGRTILNNKGNPVKQFEPYFSITPLFENLKELVETGVTPIIFYDAIGRKIQTELPDGSVTKVEYGAWKQLSYDQNDSINLVESTWLTRAALLNDPALNDAAEKTKKHAATATQTHFDSLAKEIYCIDHNGKDVQDKNIFFASAITMDIEGNTRKFTDARGNDVMTCKYDMLGHRAEQNNMDSGNRYNLNDCMGKPLQAWNNKGMLLETRYDGLHRPTEVLVTILTSNSTTIFEKFEYADTIGLTAATLAAQQILNLIGKGVTHFDKAGISKLIRCDFKGNVLKNSRQLCVDFKELPDWKNPSLINMEAAVFNSITKFDALNRVVSVVAPHTIAMQPNEIISGYNVTGMLKKIEGKLRGSNISTSFVTNITYNEKGQRQEIFYGNNTKTKYEYEKETFRLKKLFTTRNNGIIIQNLSYTYDPIGNITQISDEAQPDVFFNGENVAAVSSFEYDAMYRLVNAAGREHAGQTDMDNSKRLDFNYSKFPFKNNISANDVNVFRNYTESFKYDPTGNMLEQNHHSMGNNWTRISEYVSSNNRLAKTRIGAFSFDYTQHYDEHGNMNLMEHLKQISWNFKDEMNQIDLEGGGKAYYVYNATGERIRKVIVRNDNSRQERIYLGGFEIYREFDAANTLQLERESLHVMDDRKRVALVETKTTGMNLNTLTRYQYDNHLHSCSYELDDASNPQIISYEEYYPYGTTSYCMADATREVPAKRYRYTRKERDEESGLYYHGARYCIMWLGRWLSADPIGIAGGLNLYAYALLNPIKLSDPTGHAPDPPTNSIPDILHFIRNQAGFEAGAERALSFTSSGASPFGTAAHAKATGVVDALKGIGVQGADRIYSEVRTVAGNVTQIAGTPGGPKGSFNMDLVIVKEGETLAVGDTLTASTGELIADLKYGGGTISSKYATLDIPLGTVNGNTVASTAEEVNALTSAVGNAAKIENVVAKAGVMATVASKLAPVMAKLAPVAAKLAPVTKVLGKVAGPLGIGIGVVQMATAKTTEGKIDGGVTAVSSALMMSPHPVAKAAGAGMMAGQLIEKTLDVSDYSSSYGIKVKEGAEKLGLGETTSFVIGGVATVLSTPQAIGVAALDKISGGRFAKLIGWK